MAGIYIHIPFCKQRCSYCDFHFSTSFKQKEALIESLLQEIESRKHMLTGTINTIYFGGGTPSVLSEDELLTIVDALHKNYNIAPTVEFTLECNPDDLTQSKLKTLKNANPLQCYYEITTPQGNGLNVVTALDKSAGNIVLIVTSNHNHLLEKMKNV